MALGDRVNFICISLMPKSSNKMSAFDLPDQPATILGGHPHPSIMGGWLQSVWSPRSTRISFTTIKHRLHTTIAWGILNIDMPMCPHSDCTDFGNSILCMFLITSFVEGGGGSVFWSSSSQWPGFIHLSCYCSSLSPSCLALAGRVQSPIPGYYLAPWPLTESVHTNNN